MQRFELGIVALIVLIALLGCQSSPPTVVRATPPTGAATPAETLEEATPPSEETAPAPEEIPTETLEPSPFETPTLEGAAPGESPTLNAPAQTPGVCAPNSAFVRDVTIPDDTSLPVNTPFTKTWEIGSTGCAPWPAGTKWVFVGGDRMSAPASVPVQAVEPGSSADISVAMRAPGLFGSYKSNWQLQGPDGKRFGVVAYVSIVVKGIALPTLPPGFPTVVIPTVEGFPTISLP